MPKKKTEIAMVKHQDKRSNIPTEELRDFVAQDEISPKTMLYPRDTSLDPQLVWKGKDAQDQADLSLPVLPLYIQEKIQPLAIIEDIRRMSQEKTPSEQPGLFEDFDGIAFDQQIDFYRHSANWSNRMILGDSLYVMTSLAEKEGLKGTVQMIYLDPPYGIKFGSNWQVSTRKRDVKDGKAEDLTRQPEQIKAFRDTWELGIHSYLSYLRDRFVVARELLTESGSIFVQIGDENVHLVRCLLDEVFGSKNFVSLIPFITTSSQTSKLLSTVCDFILWYSKSKEYVMYNQLFTEKELGGEGSLKYNKVLLEDGRKFSLKEALQKYNGQLPKGAKIYRLDTLTSQSGGINSDFEVDFQDKKFRPRSGYWKTNLAGFQKLIQKNRIDIEGASLAYVRFLDDFPAYPLANVWTDFASVQSRTDPKVYVVQTSNKTIQRCLLMTTDPGDLVLDPTCGSGTTAFVAEQWGRRWITVDTSRVALALARTRLMAAKYPYYLLSDSPEGVKKQAEIEGKAPSDHSITNNIKKGFVYKQVPHITLKAIANNPEIDEIHDKWEKKLEPLRKKLNAALKQSYQEWEIPAEAPSDWSDTARQLHKDWQTFRQKRREEMDASIARHSDTEKLYDQPYEDSKRIRVAGPFTVESLSPHRILSPDQPAPASEKDARQSAEAGQFETMILDNLRKAGVQNTVKNERLMFDSLTPFAGTYIHAVGEYKEKNGTVRRVAVSIGHEHGTVAPEQVKEAVKEAVRGLGFDLLIVCGFAFDPHVSEEVKRYGQLTVLPTRMNPDLSMGDELLKKTGAGNLFMVFGEPDIDIRRTSDGQIIVAIKGLDIYDPTTGQIRSNSTDDIACWFIDTAYNEESFFVRHAYFTGADKPYENLKRALQAEIDKDAWESLYATESRAFDPPDTGKIAVKLINHYGDEVLKVYEVVGWAERRQG